METHGRLFIVAVVLLEGDPLAIAAYCEELEISSGKQKTKWRKAKHARRLNYLRRVFASTALHGRLCFVVFHDTQAYEKSTIEAISRVTRHFTTDDYRLAVYVDGLSKSKRQAYGAALRRSGIATHKVQGVAKDENNPLVRLADAVAGFTRDALDGESAEIVALFREAQTMGALIEV